MTTPTTASADQDCLAQRIQNQEIEAFREMVERFTPQILRQSRALLGSLPEAEDAAQEVFLKAFQALKQYRGGKLSSWLQTIAHHHCLDRLRRRREVPTPLDKMPLPPGPPVSDDSELVDLLAVFPDIEREVLHLRLIEEMEYAEIAAITGYTEGSLRNVIVRGVRRLREKVAKHGL